MPTATLRQYRYRTRLRLCGVGPSKLPVLKILHLEKNCYPVHTLARLESIGEVEYFETESQATLLNHLRGKSYQVIFTKLGLSMDRELMEALPELRYIVTPTTGLDHIDLDTAQSRNIRIISLKGEQEFLSTITSTSEHTWALLLALLRHLPEAKADVLNGYWRRSPFLADELYGKTLGIIGYGRLGKIVARYGIAFDMQVLAYDSDPAVFQANGPVISVSLPHLLAESDVVSLHIPSNPDNHHFFGQTIFRQMKSGAVFLNTSRGEVVDENAMLEALQNGSLSGAATDVMEGDSTWEATLPGDHPLLEYARKNTDLLITPHMGGYGKASIERTRRFVMIKFLKSIQK